MIVSRRVIFFEMIILCLWAFRILISEQFLSPIAWAFSFLSRAWSEYVFRSSFLFLFRL